MNAGRVRALASKELADLRRNPTAFVPIVIAAIVSLIIPFFIVLMLPAISGEALSGDADFRKAVAHAGAAEMAAWRSLSPEAAVQVFLFQQFLFLVLLIPVTGAMSFAAYSVIGEKQARTLEPLLATPLTTAELLVGKLIGSALPSLAITFIIFALYLAGIGTGARPGVFEAFLSIRTLLIALAIGPLVGFVALLVAVIVSSRVNDPRTAQQFAVLLVLPIMAVLVAQFAGAFWLTTPMVLVAAVVLLVLLILLTLAGIALFERETILTRWR